MATTVGTITLGSAATAFSFSGQPTAAGTITIGDVTYTYRAAVGATANEILIGANLDATLVNTAAAINATAASSGTLFGSATVANPYFTAADDAADDDIDLTARFAGNWCNGIALAKNDAAITVGGANFAAISGGTDGAGRVDTHISDILTYNQCNSEVMQELKKLTSAAD